MVDGMVTRLWSTKENSERNDKCRSYGAYSHRIEDVDFFNRSLAGREVVSNNFQGMNELAFGGPSEMAVIIG